MGTAGRRDYRPILYAHFRLRCAIPETMRYKVTITNRNSCAFSRIGTKVDDLSTLNSQSVQSVARKRL